MSDYRQQLADLREQSRLRRLRLVQSPQGRVIVLDGRELICFSSNDYLGLASHPSVIAAARMALATRGHGAGAARLLAGNLDLYQELEAALAEWLEVEAALVFGSGYLANVGVLSALATAGDTIFSDELNHASIIDGCRLSRARVEIYPHLNRPRDRPRPGARDWIVTESVFSMDGDSPVFADLLEVTRSTGARLVVDEAHAIGVVGDGRGRCRQAEVRVGTLGKALGSYGAFVAGSRELVELLINVARSFIFTTALPAPTLAAARAAVELASTDDGDERRAHLEALSIQLAAGLQSLGWPADPSSPIFPIIVGSEQQALELSHALEHQGLLVQAVRPPTVPPGTSRLRVVLSAAHRSSDVARLLDGLANSRIPT